jgi:ribosome-binding factor A
VRIRPERVAQLIRRELSDIISNKIRDPRVTQWVSITDVEVTRDLSFARVYISILGPPEERDRTLDVLTTATGYIRSQLAPRLDIREVPELRFELDTSLETGARVDDILRRLQKGETIGDEDLK